MESEYRGILDRLGESQEVGGPRLEEVHLAAHGLLRVDDLTKLNPEKTPVSLRYLRALPYGFSCSIAYLGGDTMHL